jgi:HK97 gp10 family phage protein
MAVEIEGLDGILDTLDGVVNTMTMRESMGRACAVVEAAAKQKAGGEGIKDTGTLANSIKSKVEAGGGEIVGVIYTPLEYAPYVEYGTGLFAENGGRTDVPWKYQDDKGNWHTTSGQKPQPFLRPALDENRDKIIEILEEGLLK